MLIHSKDIGLVVQLPLWWRPSNATASWNSNDYCRWSKISNVQCRHWQANIFWPLLSSYFEKMRLNESRLAKTSKNLVRFSWDSAIFVSFQASEMVKQSHPLVLVQCKVYSTKVYQKGPITRNCSQTKKSMTVSFHKTV